MRRLWMVPFLGLALALPAGLAAADAEPELDADLATTMTAATATVEPQAAAPTPTVQPASTAAAALAPDSGVAAGNLTATATVLPSPAATVLAATPDPSPTAVLTGVPAALTGSATAGSAAAAMTTTTTTTTTTVATAAATAAATLAPVPSTPTAQVQATATFDTGLSISAEGSGTQTPGAAQSDTTTAAATASPTQTPTPKPDLNEVHFGDKGGEKGLMIIAPGAASPEDSLDSFGIESPFNWKGRKGQPKTTEGLEGEPEGGLPGERGGVSVENGAGEIQPTEADYDLVERAGEVLSADELRSDGRLEVTKDGQIFGRVGVQVRLTMAPGRTATVGEVYTIFRTDGELHTHDGEATDVGTLIQNVGVLRITRVESGAVLADIEKQYTAVLEGDLIRLRDPQRLRYYALLRQGPPAADFNVKGEVAGLIPPSLFAIKGDVVYLSVGHDQGVTPGMRLMVVREHVLLSGPDDSNDMMPMGPTEPTLAQGDDLRELQPTGRIGVLEVVNTSRNASAARVVQCVGEVRAGDSVRYR